MESVQSFTVKYDDNCICLMHAHYHLEEVSVYYNLLQVYNINKC